MMVRILRDDPPKPDRMSLFVTAESEEERLFLEDLVNLCYKYLSSKSGKKIRDGEEKKKNT